MAELLPEAAWIRDDTLRSTVLRIWEQAWRTSGWDTVTACPKGPDLPGHSLVEHSRSVARLAHSMAEILAQRDTVVVDSDAVLTIALLHDVSKLHEFQPIPGGAARSVVGHRYQHGFLAAFWMHEAGLPIDLVHAVIAHTDLSTVLPQTQEALIVHYADFADSDSVLLHEGQPLFCKNTGRTTLR
ncbi:HD domain-containing protein [Nonomuraea sp. CA-143628]|uniref:HD domain-containing protein n=1 Tax=Nonomuraea sp. CA-143628 TaxID=3239997 RepID=UPI003D938B83